MHLPRLHACATGALIALAGLPTPALALWGDRLELYAQENVIYDSNIFRLSDALLPGEVAAGRVRSKSDTYYVTTLGLNLDLPVSRQRFRAGLAINDSRFDRNKQLSFTGHDASAVWLWQVGNNLSGDLGYTNVKTLASFTNVLSTVPSRVEAERAFASANYLLTPRWRLGAAVDERQRRYSDPARAVNNLDATGVDAALTYLTPRGNSIGLSHRTEEGRFPNGSLPVDNAYTQDTTTVVVDWTVTAASHLNYRAGVVNRKYENQVPGFPNRDFDGFTARLVYDWRPTARFTLSAVVLKEISAVEDIETSFVVIRGFALRPTWRITEKTTLSATLDSSERNYRGDPTVLSREDKVNSAALAVTWQALRNVQVAATLQHEKRTSNLPDLDYKFTQVGLRGRIGF